MWCEKKKLFVYAIFVCNAFVQLHFLLFMNVTSFATNLFSYHGNHASKAIMYSQTPHVHPVRSGIAGNVVTAWGGRSMTHVHNVCLARHATFSMGREIDRARILSPGGPSEEIEPNFADMLIWILLRWWWLLCRASVSFIGCWEKL